MRIAYSADLWPRAWSQWVSHGIDAMLLRFFDEARLLAADDPAHCNVSSERLHYLMKVGYWDMRAALNIVAEVYTSEVRDFL